ncbi:cupin domain-containing protein [Methylobacter tundripaludum]|uniref:hypothetical protein n=1 Tax=Methylobacter tundripaludum TaxID=173365 RepID=UPI00068BDDA5|nr:hypothetical protein [Methylobacter tundripaludum]
MNLINFKEFEERQLVAKTTNEQLSLVKALTTAFSLKGLSVHHETLLPRTKNSSAHYYTKKDELIFVLNFCTKRKSVS